MNVLITGANGFVGKNLTQRLFTIQNGRDRTRPALQVDEILLCMRDTPEEALADYCQKADFVVHLAGVNRPKDPEEFVAGNADFTCTLLEMLRKSDNRCPVLLSSSIQASLTGRFAGSLYGQSKKAAEELLFAHARETGAQALVYRLPNLFGKWCRPNYNSAVATFCHNIARDLPITFPTRRWNWSWVMWTPGGRDPERRGGPSPPDGGGVLQRPGHPPRDPGRDRPPAPDLPPPAQTLLLPEIPAGSSRKSSTALIFPICRRKDRVSTEDECGPAGQLHGTAENGELRPGFREHLKARHYQGAALAQQQVGIFHGGGRTRADSAAPNRLQ